MRNWWCSFFAKAKKLQLSNYQVFLFQQSDDYLLTKYYKFLMKISFKTYIEYTNCKYRNAMKMFVYLFGICIDVIRLIKKKHLWFKKKEM
jgi:hypothetical protein